MRKKFEMAGKSYIGYAVRLGTDDGKEIIIMAPTIQAAADAAESIRQKPTKRDLIARAALVGIEEFTSLTAMRTKEGA